MPHLIGNCFNRIGELKMFKLNKQEKAYYKNLKKEFPTTHFDIDADLGVTIARMDHGSDFYRVTIAYCGRFDQFNKKRGKYEALRKMYREQFIILPKKRNSAMFDKLNFILETI